MAPPPQVRQYLQALLGDGGRWATSGGGAKKQSENKASPGAWCCLFADCKIAERRVPNFSTRTLCRGCGRTKTHAMSPPAAFRLPPAEPTQSIKNKPEAGRNAVPGAGRPAARGRAGGKAAMDKEPQPQTSTSPEQRLVGATFDEMVVPQPAPETRELQVAVDVVKRMGITPLKDAEMAGIFRAPPANPPELRSVDDIVANAPPVVAAAHVEKLQAQVAKSKQLLALMDDNDDLYDSIKSRLATQEQELEKNVKRAPGSTLLVEQLKCAWQKEKADKVKWEEVITNGVKKAKEKLLTHAEAIDAQMAALQERRRLLIEEHEKTNAAWSGFNARKRQQWDSVLAQFETRIATAGMLPPTPVAPAQPQLALVPTAMDVGPPTAAPDQLQQAREDAAKAQAQLAIFEREHRLVAATPEHLRTFAFELSDLPTMLPEPAAEEWELYHQLWSALESIAQHEFVSGWIPVTIEQLRCGLTLPKLLLGDKLWDLAFPGTPPCESTVVTCQVRSMLWHSLQLHKDKLVADKLKHDKVIKEAMKGIDDIVTEFRAKRKKGEDGTSA